MGIRNLYKLIKEFAPNSISIVSVDSLRGWRIAIDASIAIYQWYSVGKTRNIKNSDGKYINHIQGAFFRTNAMINAGIIPLYIFDGKPPVSKNKVILQRKNERENGNGVHITRDVYEDVKKLFDLMGIQYVTAPSEAESYAARMQTCDAVSTEDMDALAFGAKIMIRGLDTAAKTVCLIKRNDLLEELNLDESAFIDLCILLGCDYTGRIKGIGYKKALALIKKYKSIENIIEKEAINVPADFDYITARNELKNPVIGDNIEPRVSTPSDQLRDYLIKTHKLDAKRVEKGLNRK